MRIRVKGTEKRKDLLVVVLVLEVVVDVVVILGRVLTVVGSGDIEKGGSTRALRPQIPVRVSPSLFP